FFFQAEDGIRDRTVTGVQTCALPIYRVIQALLGADELVQAPDERGLYGLGVRGCAGIRGEFRLGGGVQLITDIGRHDAGLVNDRSEERRVGKECKWGWGAAGGGEKGR